MPAQLVGSGCSRPIPDRDKPRLKNVGQRAVIDASKRIVETVWSQNPVRMLIKILDVPKLAGLGRFGQMARRHDQPDVGPISRNCRFTDRGDASQLSGTSESDNWRKAIDQGNSKKVPNDTWRLRSISSMKAKFATDPILTTFVAKSSEPSTAGPE
jgi:hypothetical protein